MKQELKMELRKHAQAIKGLINVMHQDADYICVDANDVDLLGLSESIPEMKDTIQHIIDHVMDLEDVVYLVKREDNKGCYER